MLKYIDALSATQRTLAITTLLLLGLASLGLSSARIHATGTPVVLATVPVDPRSLFQGDYIVLNYAISRLDKSLFVGEASPLMNPQVYVELQPGDPVWTPVRASYQQLEIKPAPGNVVIRGQARAVQSGNPVIRYGIESFMVPEGQGLPVERLRNASDRVTVRVLVAPDGAALPQNILIDGRPVFEDAGM